MKQVSTIESQACNVCHERPAHTRGRCSRCDTYWRAHGRKHERPPWIRAVAHLCSTCLQREAAIGDRCARCQRWFIRYGTERPLSTKPRGHRGPAPRTCGNGCGRAAIALGMCQACVKYWYRHGEDRPQHLIDRQKGG